MTNPANINKRQIQV